MLRIINILLGQYLPHNYMQGSPMLTTDSVYSIVTIDDSCICMKHGWLDTEATNGRALLI